MRPAISNQLEQEGWAVFPSSLKPSLLQTLRDSVFTEGAAGKRCLLDDKNVRLAAMSVRKTLIDTGICHQASAIQAIAFDKTAGTNWKVTWHQDLMFPFATPATEPGFDVPCKKEGIDYARPPVAILENLLAVRLHLDDCDLTNGPLRVCPGSHRQGIIPSRDAADYVLTHTEVTCLAAEGELLLMRPLTLHCSSPAIEPRHRRVLHFVYYSGPPLLIHWHRVIG